jgi:hypothetical protein
MQLNSDIIKSGGRKKMVGLKFAGPASIAQFWANTLRQKTY